MSASDNGGNTSDVRVLVCGSRTWSDPYPIRLALAGLTRLGNGCRPVLIHGAARGADLLAAAQVDLVSQIEAYPADWDRYGKRAGFVRNQQMLDEGKPTLVLAFRSEGESKGTDMMVSLAQQAGVPTYVVTAHLGRASVTPDNYDESMTVRTKVDVETDPGRSQGVER